MQFYLRLMKCLSASVFTTGRLCTLNRAPTPYDRYLYHHFLVQWKVAEFMGVLEGWNSLNSSLVTQVMWIAFTCCDKSQFILFSKEILPSLPSSLVIAFHSLNSSTQVAVQAKTHKTICKWIYTLTNWQNIIGIQSISKYGFGKLCVLSQHVTVLFVSVSIGRFRSFMVWLLSCPLLEHQFIFACSNCTMYMYMDC